MSEYRYLVGNCAVCGRKMGLGLTEAEIEGYQRYVNDDEDLEDALPKLNLFEREFILSGMCPDCQSNFFRKPLPQDMSRWHRF